MQLKRRSRNIIKPHRIDDENRSVTRIAGGERSKHPGLDKDTQSVSRWPAKVHQRLYYELRWTSSPNRCRSQPNWRLKSYPQNAARSSDRYQAFNCERNGEDPQKPAYPPPRHFYEEWQATLDKSRGFSNFIFARHYDSYFKNIFRLNQIKFSKRW